MGHLPTSQELSNTPNLINVILHPHTRTTHFRYILMLFFHQRLSITSGMLIKIQPDVTVCIYLFTERSLHMFRVSQHPSSGVLKTVPAASGTCHNIGLAVSLQCGQIETLRFKISNFIILYKNEIICIMKNYQ